MHVSDAVPRTRSRQLPQGCSRGRCAALLWAQDLERFLPNDGNSVYHASGLLRQWPAEPRALAARLAVVEGAVVEARTGLHCCGNRRPAGRHLPDPQRATAGRP